jgi:hypothetical protein
MTFGSILLGLALLVLVSLYVARPLIAPAISYERKSTDYNGLRALKDAYLAQIHNLDFDYETGKIPENDYQRLRSALMADARVVLIQMDEIEEIAISAGEIASVSVEPEITSSDIDSEIEAAVAHLRQSRIPPSPTESELIGVSAVIPGASNGEPKFCPQCGFGVKPKDKFCVSCGHQLKVPRQT